MVILLGLRWWYGAGWQWAMQKAIVDRLKWCNETFSILALAQTWFSPFKQTYSQANGSIDVQMHALLDNVISRFVGFFARSFIIFTGLFVALLAFLSGVIFIALWPLAPFALPISLVMMVAGVGK
ncbi:MAG: hypothetical protein QG553_855 [Patescibacteria group bacterium]|nr:hypothetical protein [Patescibacteria group bacterium]